MPTIEAPPRATLGNVVADLVVELGRRGMTLGEVRRMQAGDVVELDKLAGEAFQVLINQRCFAEGEIVVVTDLMAVRITLAKRVIEDLEATWEPILRVEITDIELETNPEFMQITAASEIVILLAFEVNSTNASGLVSLCYPFFTLESILPRLGQQSYVRTARTNREELIQQNNLRLNKTFLPVTAELGRTQISLGEARTLKAGDIICSDTPKTGRVVVFVEEEPKFLARPFAGENGKQALKVGGVIPPGHEEIYKNRSKPVA